MGMSSPSRLLRSNAHLGVCIFLLLESLVSNWLWGVAGGRKAYWGACSPIVSMGTMKCLVLTNQRTQIWNTNPNLDTQTAAVLPQCTVAVSSFHNSHSPPQILY